MCIVALAHSTSDRYRLVVAANRDERHARPSAAADWWHGPGSLLAGRDLEAGGTWLGVTGAGRFAAVTNIFEGRAATGKRSRGELITGFLEATVDPADYAAEVEGRASAYGPFNLVLAAGDTVEFVSNRHPLESLGPGVHVFSNNAPGLEWSKVNVLGDAIESAIRRDDLVEFLVERLSGPDARGPLADAANSLFVVGDEFGTRCTTVLTIDAKYRAHFVEQRFGPGGIGAGRSEFSFVVSP